MSSKNEQCGFPPEYWQKYKKKKVVVEAYRNVARHTIEVPRGLTRDGISFDFVEVKVGSWIIKDTWEVLTQEAFTARYCPLDSNN